MAVDIYKYIALDKTETDKKPRSVHLSGNTNADLKASSHETGFSQNLIVKLGCEAAKEQKKKLRNELFKKKKELFKSKI